MLAVFAFLIGASVGSFLNLAADRVPTGRSVVKPRSFCESCNTQLATRDLIPILSYFWIRGKCHYCSAPIPLRFMAVEALMAALFTVIYIKYGLEVEFVLLAAAVSLMMVIALIDLEYGIIPNKIILPSLIVLILLSPFWTELGLTRSFLGNDNLVGTLINSIVTGLGAFLVFLSIALIYPNGMGGGDVKLGGVIGLLLGYPGALLALWLAVVSAGMIAMLLLVMHKLSRKDSMPFGPFLAMGAVVALLAGSEISAWYNELGNLLAGV